MYFIVRFIIFCFLAFSINSLSGQVDATINNITKNQTVTNKQINEREKDEAEGEKLTAFKITNHGTSFTVDSNRRVKIYSNFASSYFKVNKGLYIGEIDKAKLITLNKILDEFQVSSRLQTGIVRPSFEIMDGTSRSYNFIFKNKTVGFDYYNAPKGNFIEIVDTLLFSISAINSYNLKFISKTKDTINHKIIENSKTYNDYECPIYIIGFPRLIESFNSNEHIYKVRIDSSFIFKNLKFGPHSNYILCESDKLISEKYSVGLVVYSKTVWKKRSFHFFRKQKVKELTYYVIEQSLTPSKSYFFEFSIDYDWNEKICKTGGYQKANFSKLEKRIFKLKRN